MFRGTQIGLRLLPGKDEAGRTTVSGVGSPVYLTGVQKLDLIGWEERSFDSLRSLRTIVLVG